MTGTPGGVTPHEAAYSPRCRTGLVLVGEGADGIYHAGVLKALAEAGVRIDVVAGQGIGVVGAFFTAVDGGTRLWGEDAAWRQPEVARLLRLRPAVRALGWASGAALATVVVPAVALALGSLVFLGAFLVAQAGIPAGAEWADAYTRLVRQAFLPDRLPTWVPHIALSLLSVVFVLLIGAASRGRIKGRFRERGAFWWRVFGAPVDVRPSTAFWRGELWRLLGGGAPVAIPDDADLSRRYADLLGENLGQPGFRELIAVVHDLDSRQDVTLAALMEPHRGVFFGRRPGTFGPGTRAGEALDLVGIDREHAIDVLAASQCLPMVMPAWPVTFAPESHWCGETHRLCDRPGAVGRLLDDVLAAGVEQAIVVVATPIGVAAPHALVAPRVDAIGRLGDWLASQQTAALREALGPRVAAFRTVHVIAPAHNPVGPADLAGTYDERSDRVQGGLESMDRGYADAYGQFIEPVVGGGD